MAEVKEIRVRRIPSSNVSLYFFPFTGCRLQVEIRSLELFMWRTFQHYRNRFWIFLLFGFLGGF